MVNLERSVIHIVEDDEVIREIFSEIIHDFGCRTLLFSSPTHYLGYMNEPDYSSPLAIISDVRMPEMNGYDFMHQVRQLNPFQKFVIVTGSPEIEHKYKNLACMYLCKPFNPDSLKHHICLFLQCDKNCGLDNAEGRIHDDRILFNLNKWSCPNNK